MNVAIRRAAAVAAGLLILSQAALAQAQQLGTARSFFPTGDTAGINNAVPKAASTQTLGSRATVTSSATLFGGFQLAQGAVVYILVRGNSLQTLGVTNDYLDAPRVRIFNSAGQDQVTDNFGQPGFNGCTAGNEFNDAVVTYYQNVRGQPAHARDACFAAFFPAGTYTFTATPTIPGVTASPQSGSSNPGAGQVLFEITLGP